MAKNLKMHGQKVRTNLSINPQVYNILKEAAMKNGRSMSKIIEHLVMTHVSDRAKVIMSEKRALAKRMNDLDEELEYININKNASKN